MYLGNFTVKEIGHITQNFTDNLNVLPEILLNTKVKSCVILS